jgi:hypothetical protein
VSPCTLLVNGRSTNCCSLDAHSVVVKSGECTFGKACMDLAAVESTMETHQPGSSVIVSNKLHIIGCIGAVQVASLSGIKIRNKLLVHGSWFLVRDTMRK